MKIAMFADSYYPTVDGAVVAMDLLSDGLERKGHEIVVLAPDVPERARTNRNVHYLPSREYRHYPGYRMVVSPGDMLEYLRREKVDVIHSHGLASMAILSLTSARALKIPHVLTFHTMANEAIRYYSPLPIRQDLIENLVWVYLRNMMKRPEVVVVPSLPIKEELETNGVMMKRCEVVPTGVDCAKFSPERYDRNFLKRFGLEGKRVVLHVGRLSREKHLEVILEALAEILPEETDVRLLVVGSGPASQYYKDMGTKLEIADKVVFAGFLPDEDLPVAYASCDVLAIASTFETQGLVVLEALASGLPVAGRRYRAIPEFVQEGKNGCLFEPDTCAEAIRRCLHRAESMKISAVSSAMEHSIDSSAAKLEKVYELARTVLDESKK